LVAANFDGAIYTSTNAGANWTLSDAPSLQWGGVASSADGVKLAAAVYGGPIYMSTNSGGTWTQASAPAANWYSISSSADGTRLVAGIFNGGVYTSDDSGLSWSPVSAPTARWSAVASSTNGNRRFGAVYGGGIYLSPPPLLSLSCQSNSVVLSWSSSAVGFVLEQRTNVSAAWIAVTNTPLVTNSQYRVVQPMVPSGRNFYRLRGS
jgi:hypothetical protein